MTQQEQDFIFAKMDAKVADIRGDVRLNTQSLSDLKDRFNDLSGKMGTVPTDIATLKTKVEHLPTKGFIVVATTGALGLVAALSAYIQWVLSAHAAVGGAHP